METYKINKAKSPRYTETPKIETGVWHHSALTLFVQSILQLGYLVYLGIVNRERGYSLKKVGVT